MTWWYWLFLGLVLAGAEMLAPGGFYLLFFGIAALIVGTLAGREIIQEAWVQWLSFSAVAIVSLVLFRGHLLSMMKGARRMPPVDTMVGETAVLIENLSVGETGKAELRGTTWSVRNIDTRLLASGERCRVVAVRDLELDIRAERGP